MKLKNLFKIAILLCFYKALAFAATPALEYRISGISGKALSNVQNRLQTEQKAIAPPVSSSKILIFYQNAPENISKALEPYGYFHAKIHSRLTRSQGTWIAYFNITPGPRVRILSKDIRLSGPGASNPQLARYVDGIASKLGPYLDTELYEKLKDNFFDLAQTNGYLNAVSTEHVITVNRQTNTAQIVLHFDTGPRYYFGPIFFSENPLSRDFLLRYLPFKEGAPYSAAQLLTLQNNLAGTVYFTRVNVKPKIKEARNYQIPIDVALTPAKSQQYSFGVGYGTDTGARGSVGWKWRHITRTGHYFQTLLQISQKRNNSLQANYVIPGKNPVTDYYSLTAGLFTNEVANSNNRYTVGQIGANYVSLRRGWQRTLSLQLQRERFTINNLTTTTNTLVPTVAWERVRAHNRINVRNGYRIYMSLSAGAVQGYSGSFLQSETQGKYIRSFQQQNYRLLLRGNLGATLVKDFSSMPLSHRFFAGGSQSIRGYNYQALPTNNQGGRYLVVGSVEMQRRIHGNVYGAVFYDAGNAVQNFPLQPQSGYGIGVVYRSPIGPLELTVAHAVGTDFQIKHLKIQFVMGSEL